MKKTMLFIVVIFTLTFMLTSCSSSGGIPDGTYAMTSNTNGLGIGSTFTVKGNTITVPIYGVNLPGVDYTYKIDGKNIKITAQGATLSYSYEKKGDSYIIGDVEYTQGEADTDNLNDISQTMPMPTQPTQINSNEPTENIAESSIEPIPSYEPLNLSITMEERTFFIGGVWQTPELTITDEGDLIKSGEFIDSDVRSCLNGSTYFYIKQDNSLWGWGSNTAGSLGDGTGVNQDKPVKILDNVAWIGNISSGNSFYGFCAIKTDKTLWGWGDGKNYAPVMLAENVVRQLYGFYFLNIDGFIFDYRTGEHYIDEPVYDANFEVQYGSASNFLSSAYIDSNKNLWLRKNNYGDITNTLVAESVEKFSGVSSIRFIKSDGTLWGYGKNGDGQLGDGTKIPERIEAVKIADEVLEIYDYAFLKLNGEAWIWDSNNPVPRKLLDDVVQMGHYQQGLKYIITTDNKILYYIYFSDWDVFVEPDSAKNVRELKDVKMPQVVTFP